MSFVPFRSLERVVQAASEEAATDVRSQIGATTNGISSFPPTFGLANPSLQSAKPLDPFTPHDA